MRIAYTRTTGVGNVRPYLQCLGDLFEHHGVTAKLFFISSERSSQDFPGEVQRLDPGIRAAELAEYLRAWRADGLVSLSVPDDGALRDALVGDILDTHEVPSIVHSAHATKVLANKWETRLLLESFGLPVAPGILVDGQAISEENLLSTVYADFIVLSGAGLGYPLLTKPLWDSLGYGIAFHHDESSLSEYFASRRGGNVVLEKFIRGDLYSIEIVGKDGRYVFQPLLWKGLTEAVRSLYYTEVRHSLADHRAIAALDPMKERLIDLCRHLGINGVVEVEMIFDGRDFHVIEINPRVSGTTVLSIAASGINTFEALTKMLLGIWPEYASSVDRDRRTDRFSVQFPHQGIKPGLDGFEFELVQSTSFQNAGSTYHSATVSGPKQALTRLGDGIRNHFHITAETECRIRRIESSSR